MVQNAMQLESVANTRVARTKTQVLGMEKLSTCTDDEFTFQAVINKKSVFCQAIVDIA